MPWLMKAEPDSRIVKGKDVRFSVDDFEKIGVSTWDGVRNHEAKNIMKDKMKLGDLVLFYHSNCKTPGVFALAVVEKEGYPDFTAWDTTHPYYDPKSSSDSPTWFMVSVKFVRRLAHPVTLAFIKSLVGLAAPPKEIDYIGVDGLKSIQSMALVNRGRLSVQPVEKDAYDAIVALGDKGGWDEAAAGKKAPKPKVAAATKPKPVPKPKPASKPAAKKKRKGADSESEDDASEDVSEEDKPAPKKKKAGPAAEAKKEAKPKAPPKPVVEGTRRSARVRK